jgi:hypothetical protein
MVEEADDPDLLPRILGHWSNPANVVAVEGSAESLESQ